MVDRGRGRAIRASVPALYSGKGAREGIAQFSSGPPGTGKGRGEGEGGDGEGAAQSPSLALYSGSGDCGAGGDR